MAYPRLELRPADELSDDEIDSRLRILAAYEHQLMTRWQPWMGTCVRAAGAAMINYEARSRMEHCERKAETVRRHLVERGFDTVKSQNEEILRQAKAATDRL